MIFLKTFFPSTFLLLLSTFEPTPTHALPTITAGKNHHLYLDLLRYVDPYCNHFLDIPYRLGGYNKISSAGNCVAYPDDVSGWYRKGCYPSHLPENVTYFGWEAWQFSLVEGSWSEGGADVSGGVERERFSVGFGKCDFVLFGNEGCKGKHEIGRIEYVNEGLELGDESKEGWQLAKPRCWTAEGVVHSVRMECSKDGEQVKKVDMSINGPGPESEY